MTQQSSSPDLAKLRHELESLSVPSLFPDSPDFDRHAQSYNRVFSYKPAAICVPETDDSVSNAIRCAHAHGLKVQCKSGGHSYGAFSSGGQDGSMIVHMKHFNFVELDTNTNVTVVGAGVRLGQLSSELFRQGKRALPHGTIKNVGVGGHFSHGGYGYQSRAWGLGLDTICGLDVVLADGRRVHVTAEGEPELWFVRFLLFNLPRFGLCLDVYQILIISYVEQGLTWVSRFLWHHHAIPSENSRCAGTGGSLLF